MGEVQQQLQVLADELNMMKNELVGLKANHSALHNVAVETDKSMRANQSSYTTRFEQLEKVVSDIRDNVAGGAGSGKDLRSP